MFHVSFFIGLYCALGAVFCAAPPNFSLPDIDKIQTALRSTTLSAKELQDYLDQLNRQGAKVGAKEKRSFDALVNGTRNRIIAAQSTESLVQKRESEEKDAQAEVTRLATAAGTIANNIDTAAGTTNDAERMNFLKDTTSSTDFRIWLIGNQARQDQLVAFMTWVDTDAELDAASADTVLLRAKTKDANSALAAYPTARSVADKKGKYRGEVNNWVAWATPIKQARELCEQYKGDKIKPAPAPNSVAAWWNAQLDDFIVRINAALGVVPYVPGDLTNILNAIGIEYVQKKEKYEDGLLGEALIEKYRRNPSVLLKNGRTKLTVKADSTDGEIFDEARYVLIEWFDGLGRDVIEQKSKTVITARFSEFFKVLSDERSKLAKALAEQKEAIAKIAAANNAAMAAALQETNAKLASTQEELTQTGASKQAVEEGKRRVEELTHLLATLAASGQVRGAGNVQQVAGAGGVNSQEVTGNQGGVVGVDPTLAARARAIEMAEQQEKEAKEAKEKAAAAKKAAEEAQKAAMIALIGKSKAENIVDAATLVQTIQDFTSKFLSVTKQEKASADDLKSLFAPGGGKGVQGKKKATSADDPWVKDPYMVFPEAATFKETQGNTPKKLFSVHLLVRSLYKMIFENYLQNRIENTLAGLASDDTHRLCECVKEAIEQDNLAKVMKEDSAPLREVIQRLKITAQGIQRNDLADQSENVLNWVVGLYHQLEGFVEALHNSCMDVFVKNASKEQEFTKRYKQLYLRGGKFHKGWQKILQRGNQFLEEPGADEPAQISLVDMWCAQVNGQRQGLAVAADNQDVRNGLTLFAQVVVSASIKPLYDRILLGTIKDKPDEWSRAYATGVWHLHKLLQDLKDKSLNSFGACAERFLDLALHPYIPSAEALLGSKDQPGIVRLLANVESVNQKTYLAMAEQIKMVVVDSPSRAGRTIAHDQKSFNDIAADEEKPEPVLPQLRGDSKTKYSDITDDLAQRVAKRIQALAKPLNARAELMRILEAQDKTTGRLLIESMSFQEAAQYVVREIDNILNQSIASNIVLPETDQGRLMPTVLQERGGRKLSDKQILEKMRWHFEKIAKAADDPAFTGAWQGYIKGLGSDYAPLFARKAEALLQERAVAPTEAKQLIEQIAGNLERFEQKKLPVRAGITRLLAENFKPYLVKALQSLDLKAGNAEGLLFTLECRNLLGCGKQRWPDFVADQKELFPDLESLRAIEVDVPVQMASLAMVADLSDVIKSSRYDQVFGQENGDTLAKNLVNKVKNSYRTALGNAQNGDGNPYPDFIPAIAQCLRDRDLKKAYGYIVAAAVHIADPLYALDKFPAASEKCKVMGKELVEAATDSVPDSLSLPDIDKAATGTGATRVPAVVSDLTQLRNLMKKPDNCYLGTMEDCLKGVLLATWKEKRVPNFIKGAFAASRLRLIDESLSTAPYDETTVDGKLDALITAYEAVKQNVIADQSYQELVRKFDKISDFYSQAKGVAGTLVTVPAKHHIKQYTLEQCAFFLLFYYSTLFEQGALDKKVIQAGFGDKAAMRNKIPDALMMFIIRHVILQKPMPEALAARTLGGDDEISGANADILKLFANQFASKAREAGWQDAELGDLEGNQVVGADSLTPLFPRMFDLVLRVLSPAGTGNEGGDGSALYSYAVQHLDYYTALQKAVAKDQTRKLANCLENRVRNYGAWLKNWRVQVCGKYLEQMHKIREGGLKGTVLKLADLLGEDEWQGMNRSSPVVLQKIANHLFGLDFQDLMIDELSGQLMRRASPTNLPVTADDSCLAFLREIVRKPVNEQLFEDDDGSSITYKNEQVREEVASCMQKYFLQPLEDMVALNNLKPAQAYELVAQEAEVVCRPDLAARSAWLNQRFEKFKREVESLRANGDWTSGRGPSSDAKVTSTARKGLQRTARSQMAQMLRVAPGQGVLLKALDDEQMQARAALSEKAVTAWQNVSLKAVSELQQVITDLTSKREHAHRAGGGGVSPFIKAFQQVKTRAAMMQTITNAKEGEISAFDAMAILSAILKQDDTNAGVVDGLLQKFIDEGKVPYPIDHLINRFGQFTDELRRIPSLLQTALSNPRVDSSVISVLVERGLEPGQDIQVYSNATNEDFGALLTRTAQSRERDFGIVRVLCQADSVNHKMVAGWIKQALMALPQDSATLNGQKIDGGNYNSGALEAALWRLYKTAGANSVESLLNSKPDGSAQTCRGIIEDLAREANDAFGQLKVLAEALSDESQTYDLQVGQVPAGYTLPVAPSDDGRTSPLGTNPSPASSATASPVVTPRARSAVQQFVDAVLENKEKPSKLLALFHAAEQEGKADLKTALSSAPSGYHVALVDVIERNLTPNPEAQVFDQQENEANQALLKAIRRLAPAPGARHVDGVEII